MPDLAVAYSTGVFEPAMTERAFKAARQQG